MQKCIKNYKKAAQLLEIYTEDDEDAFVLGFIREDDENHILIECIDSVAQYAGISVVNLDGLTEIKSNTIYARKFQYFLGKSNYVKKTLNIAKDNLLNNFIQHLYEKRQVVTIVTLSSIEYTGVISNTFSESVELTIMNCNGYFDGVVSIDFAEILSVTFESRNEKKFEILHSIQI